MIAAPLLEAGSRRPVTLCRLAVLALGIAAVARDADASGFYLTQQNVPTIGRATAGQVVAAHDAATVVGNPAGMTELDGAQVMAGVSVLLPKTSFRNHRSSATTPGTGGSELPYAGSSGGNPFGPEALPNAYAALHCLAPTCGLASASPRPSASAWTTVATGLAATTPSSRALPPSTSPWP